MSVALLPIVPNLIGGLLEELERVIVMREAWREMGKADREAKASFVPGIVLMTVAIDGAKRAIAQGDVISELRALADLRGFEN